MVCIIFIVCYCNIGISVYIDVGKIIIIECILFYIGVNYKIGEVYDGVVIMDWMEQEQECGIIIIFVVIIVFWFGMVKQYELYCINIIDILGYVDFIIEVECFMCVFDGVVMVYCVVGGVQLQFEIVWCQVNKYKVLCIVFVNKMDCMGVNFLKVVNQIKICLGVNLVLLQLVIGVEEYFIGVVDLVKMKVINWNDVDQGVIFEYEDILVDMVELVNEWYQNLIEFVVEVFEELMEKYLGGEELIEVEIKGVLCQCVLNNEIILVICGFVFKNKGVQVMLDVVIDYLLFLVDVFVINGILDDGKDILVECYVSDDELFFVLVFKIVIDLFVGNLIFFCVYFGVVNFGDIVLNFVKVVCECFGCIVQMYVNKCEEIKEVCVGDIVVVIGLKDVIIGDILCDLDVLIILECMEFFELVIFIVVELKIKVDQEKMGLVLGCLVKEDLFFCVWIDEEFNQIIIVGMGELYFDIIVDCMKCEFNVEVNVGKLQVVYCEIICQKVIDVEGKYVKQFGGCGQYGYVVIDMYLLELGLNLKGYEFINDIKGGVIFGEYILVVDKGIQEQLKVGLLVGYLVVDMGICLYFGFYYDVDFFELVFKLVVFIVFKEGFKKVKLVLFELIMKVEVEILEENIGDVIGDLSCCCGMFKGQEFEVIGVKIYVEVLLFEMFGYVIQLCFLIKGCVLYIMEFLKYDEVLSNVVQVVIEVCGK